MPRETPVPGSPPEWMVRARSDLALAKAPLPDGALYDDLCFHAQQAAEKAIKAVYRAHHWEFRYTHDLGDLLDGLQRKGLDVPAQILNAVELTEYAWHARYPGTGEPVSEAEHRSAVTQAEKVVRWAELLVVGK